MIVLKILLYIFLAVLGIILLVLITPAGGEVSYIDGKLSYKVKLWVLNLADSEGGGVYGWLKKRKSSKKPPKIRHRKQRAVKKREPYEWEKELDDIPVNDSEEPLPDEKSTENAAESENKVSETSAEADSTAADNITDNGQTAENNEKTDAPAEDDSDGFPDEESVGRTGSRKSFDEKLETLIGIWECAQRPMLKIYKGFMLSDMYIDFVIADEYAFDCALRYG